jgi:pimeloyl-ACP methyl ester carboxylesterase
VRVTSDVITLSEGRRLRWHEFGDPGGSPVLYTAGTPVSGLGGGTYDESARAAGLRWISPDKPGYGGSGYQRKRSLAGWGDDLAALAGRLGLDRFALAGESGGAPFTLAAAHAALRLEIEAVGDALRQGVRGTAQELALIKRPWPFPLSEVITPVHLWHGAVDRNAPITFARRLARELPDAILHVSETSGHDVGRDRSSEIRPCSPPA